MNEDTDNYVNSFPLPLMHEHDKRKTIEDYRRKEIASVGKFDKSKLSYGPPSTEYASSNKVDAQTRVSEGIQGSELSVPEVAHLGNRKGNDKQHGNLHTCNTSLNNNFNTIPVRITNRGHVTSNRTESFQNRKKHVRSYAHNNQGSNGGPLGSHYGPLCSTNLNESKVDFFRTEPVRKPKDPCLPRKISRDKILFYRFHY